MLLRHPLGQVCGRSSAQYTVYIYPLGVFDPLTMLRPWLLVVAIAALAAVVAWVLLAIRPGIRRRPCATGWGLSRNVWTARRMALGVVAVLCLVVGAASELGVYKGDV